LIKEPKTWVEEKIAFSTNGSEKTEYSLIEE
jgi:hypothetical protein